MWPGLEYHNSSSHMKDGLASSFIPKKSTRSVKHEKLDKLSLPIKLFHLITFHWWNSVWFWSSCAAAGQSSENKEPVIAGVNPVAAGHPFSIPLGYPAADYQHLSYVPRYEPNPQYFRQYTPRAFSLSTHAISHAAPHAVSRDNHQATPYLTGPFNTHHLEPYVDHHDRPFGNEMKIMFMLNVN